MRWLKDISDQNLTGRRVLLRLDLNVPIENGVVSDDFRIKQSLPTLHKLVAAGARVTVLAHLGKKGASISPVAAYLKKLFPTVTILENLRLDSGEESNAPEFAAKLAAQGDLYINDAFSASHRVHASIVGLPQLLPGAAGLEFAAEVRHLSRLFQPARPFLAIIGGAKFGTKLPLVRHFLGIADHIFIGGALAHPIFKLRGWEIGKSLSDDAVGDLSDLAHNSKVIIPSEVVVKQNEKTFVTTPDRVPTDGTIVDAGARVLADLGKIINDAATILWNGPLGNYEHGYGEPTQELGKMIVKSRAETVIGGGDTIAALESLNIFDQFGFVSTAGGAMLDYLVKGTLPGIIALEENAKKFTTLL